MGRHRGPMTGIERTDKLRERARTWNGCSTASWLGAYLVRSLDLNKIASLDTLLQRGAHDVLLDILLLHRNEKTSAGMVRIV